MLLTKGRKEVQSAKVGQGTLGGNGTLASSAETDQERVLARPGRNPAFITFS